MASVRLSVYTINLGRFHFWNMPKIGAGWPMQLEWDDRKAEANLAKHGIDFASIERFEILTALVEVDDRKDYGEIRLAAIGLLDEVVMVVIYTEREEDTDGSYRCGSPTGKKLQPMWKRPDEKPSGTQRADARRRAQSALDRMTDAQDAKITREALDDPDAQPVDELFRRGRGRPRAAEGTKKVPVSIKLDPDIVKAFRGTGSGWQTRVNDILRREAAQLSRPAEGRDPEQSRSKLRK